jgi:hypothetical protein
MTLPFTLWAVNVPSTFLAVFGDWDEPEAVESYTESEKVIPLFWRAKKEV